MNPLQSSSSALPALQRRIGLTGGVGMGKSTVSRYLATHHHCPIADADVYAREAVQPGSAILTAIAQRYGSEMLLPDGSLNRPLLGQKIFGDAQERHWLEAQIHPYVRDRLVAAIESHSLSPNSQPLILDIPLLFEAQMTDLTTEIWVVACDLNLQLQRLQARDRLTPAQAQARIASQWPIAQKLAQADVILRNDSTLEALYAQIDRAISPDFDR